MLTSEVLFLPFYLFTFLPLFNHDWLVLRNQCLHDAPAYEVSYTTDAEYNHVGTWLAIEAHETEGGTLTICVGEEHTGTLVDQEGTDTTCHRTNTGDGSYS